VLRCPFSAHRTHEHDGSELPSMIHHGREASRAQRHEHIGVERCDGQDHGRSCPAQSVRTAVWELIRRAIMYAHTITALNMHVATNPFCLAFCASALLIRHSQTQGAPYTVRPRARASTARSFVICPPSPSIPPVVAFKVPWLLHNKLDRWFGETAALKHFLKRGFNQKAPDEEVPSCACRYWRPST